MLTLAALTFALMEEVQAADPNATFLDDDSISYKDLAHGAFELVTKEAIPRHIIVEDPGETVVLSRIGSSVSVNQFANSATRMEELQAAQQEVLANYANGLGHPGSSSLPLFETLPGLEPINFIQTEDAAEQNSLPPIPSSGVDRSRGLPHTSAAVAADVDHWRLGRSKPIRWCLTPSPRQAELSSPAVRNGATTDLRHQRGYRGQHGSGWCDI